jgi:hypothetical protein
MNLRFSNFGVLRSPEDGTGTGGSEDTFELLNVDDPIEKVEPLDIEEKDEKEEKEVETKVEEEEVDELEEIEKELKQPTEEDLLELTTPVRRREILAKYPTLFKDFPYLEKAYYREQQFTETFPTIQDAKLAAEKANILDRTEREVMNGDITSVLLAARSEDMEAFHKIADNYLPTLRKVDQQAYFHVIGNVIKDTIVTMVREGRGLGDQGAPLTAAANVLNQFIFGSQQFTPSRPLTQHVDPNIQNQQNQIRQQERERAYTQFTSLVSDLQGKADNVLRATIDGHIDPNKSMTDYVKNHATAEAFDKLSSLIDQDNRFRSLLDKLWDRAHESGFDKASTDRIKSAYLSKAKTLLPSVIKSARNNALKGMSGSNEVEERPTRRSPINHGTSAAPSSGRIRKPSDIPKGMSTLDVLMKD